MTEVLRQEVKKGLMVQLPVSLWLSLSQHCLAQALSKREFLERLIKNHLAMDNSQEPKK